MRCGTKKPQREGEKEKMRHAECGKRAKKGPNCRMRLEKVTNTLVGSKPSATDDQNAKTKV